MHILEKIVAHKIKEVAIRKERYPIALLKKSAFYKRPTISMSAHVKREDRSGIIAEYKRRSPSKPTINLYADVEETSVAYMQAGASALSILTDEHFFGGKSEDLTIARRYNSCPILRKDFIIDTYQIKEARSIGADAILLIAEILTKEKVRDLTSAANDLGLEVLMEIHSEDQLEKYNDTINLLGVNNRNLDTFVTDIQTSIDLYSKLPSETVKISESGLHNVEAIHQLKSQGYDGFLIGEMFMASADPGAACQQLVRDLQAVELW